MLSELDKRWIERENVGMLLITILGFLIVFAASTIDRCAHRNATDRQFKELNEKIDNLKIEKGPIYEF